jgi:4-amino-4-deoxy-L-arabinose transferase-like glycosyltransferase
MRGELAKNKHPLHLLIITVLVFGVYLSALKAGFLAMDDVSTLRSIQSASISIGSLLFSSGNDYYRPLTILSFHADFLLFGNNPAGYHLTNILLHLANSVLVYILATELLSNGRNAGRFPLFVALLFALHPINSEAVIWISGRTDLLCCFFALICLIILLKRGRSMTPLIFLGLLLSLLCSLASKESSLFLPLLAIFYFIMERKTLTAKNELSACSALGFAVIVYLLLREGLPVAQAVAVRTTIPAVNHSFPYVIEGTAALGFYLQKLFYPFPLSIAITEIATIFCLALFLSFCGVAAILWKKISALRFPLAFLGTSLVPPLGVFFLSLAWTPYAERYLYIPSVAFALCTGALIHHYREKAPGFIATLVITLLAIPTAYRVNLWTKPIPFWEDAVAKSPYFGTVRLPLVAAYIEAGRLADAEKSLREADTLGLPRKSAREFSLELWNLLENRKTLGHTTRVSITSQPAKAQQ